MASERQRLVDLVSPIVEAAGLALEGTEVTRVGRRRLVRIVVDLPEQETGSVDLDRVAEVSRAVGRQLDEVDDVASVIGSGPYSLEVGTPGVDRPLTERRHWLRARTRLVRVQRHGGDPVTGRLVSVADSGPVLELDGDERTLAWDEVRSARVEVEFGSRAGGGRR